MFRSLFARPAVRCIRRVSTAKPPDSAQFPPLTTELAGIKKILVVNKPENAKIAVQAVVDDARASLKRNPHHKRPLLSVSVTRRRTVGSMAPELGIAGENTVALFRLGAPNGTADTYAELTNLICDPDIVKAWCAARVSIDEVLHIIRPGEVIFPESVVNFTGLVKLLRNDFLQYEGSIVRKVCQAVLGVDWASFNENIITEDLNSPSIHRASALDVWTVRQLFPNLLKKQYDQLTNTTHPFEKVGLLEASRRVLVLWNSHDPSQPVPCCEVATCTVPRTLRGAVMTDASGLKTLKHLENVFVDMFGMLPRVRLSDNAPGAPNRSTLLSGFLLKDDEDKVLTGGKNCLSDEHTRWQLLLIMLHSLPNHGKSWNRAVQKLQPSSVNDKDHKPTPRSDNVVTVDERRDGEDRHIEATQTEVRTDHNLSDTTITPIPLPVTPIPATPTSFPVSLQQTLCGLGGGKAGLHSWCKLARAVAPRIEWLTVEPPRTSLREIKNPVKPVVFVHAPSMLGCAEGVLNPEWLQFTLLDPTFVFDGDKGPHRFEHKAVDVVCDLAVRWLKSQLQCTGTQAK